jgi:hypothetical protein
MRRHLIAAAAALVAGLASIGPAVADTSQAAVVSADPVDNTPHVLDGTVRAIVVVGGTAVVGGDFYRVRDVSQQTTYRRANIFAYEIATCRMLGFAPELDGAVYALAAGPAGTVHAGGAFHHVTGAAQRGITQLRLDNAQRVTGGPAPTAGAAGRASTCTCEGWTSRLMAANSWR